MLQLFAEQLNAVYSVTGKPLITFPLTVEQTYLVAVELRRSQRGLHELVRNQEITEDMIELAEFYQNVYEELVELTE